ncbi:MAG: tRNA uracil 4-sulfurtransferase ThiI [Methanobacteriota archaeon]
MESGRPGAIMVRFGELFLKSEPVRRQFMKVLIGNIRTALTSHHLNYTIEDNRSRIVVRTDDASHVIPILSRIFGVVDIAPAFLTQPTIEALSHVAADMGAEHLKPGMSFAIRARRDQVPGFSSQELGAEAGGAVIDRVPGISVDLTHPDYEIFLEARKEGGIAYDTRIPGPGGLPYNTQGSLLSLLSAGIDSPVASWLMMKRGVKVKFLYIDTGRYAGKDCYTNVLRNLSALSTWTPGLHLSLTVIHAEPFFERLMADAEPRFRCVLCKRGMLKMAAILAEKNGIPGIITGDNLGQVATQTLHNIITISSGVTIPVLRPLIGYDKEDIINLARRIGTFTQDPGDTSCGVVPPRPATASVQIVIEQIEKRLITDQIFLDMVYSSEKLQMLNGETLPS